MTRPEFLAASSLIPFLTFTARLGPVALLGLVVIWILLVLLYPGEFRNGGFPRASELPVNTYPPLRAKDLIATGLLIVALVLGIPIAPAALLAAAFLLITRRVRASRVFHEGDWSLPLFFGGLFIVTAAIETNGWTERVLAWVLPLAERGVAPLASVAALLSNLVSRTSRRFCSFVHSLRASQTPFRVGSPWRWQLPLLGTSPCLDRSPT